MTLATAPAAQTPPRRLSLQGAVNVRDLGGYPAADGRRVRWGQLYRGDQLAELSNTDVSTLQTAGIRTVCDLRGASERQHKPNRSLGPDVRVHDIGFIPEGGDALLAGVGAGDIGAGEIRERVIDIYRGFVVDQAETFGRLLTLLADAHTPLLYHCTSGRDRTGWASAVILLALGASRDTVAADYALSNDYRRDLSFQLSSPVAAPVMTALTQAHPDYLRAAFACVDDGWGTDAAYLRDALGCGAAQQQHLRARFLEAA